MTQSISGRMLDPRTPINWSLNAWLQLRNPDFIVTSDPIEAPAWLVMLFLANPHNEHWYPTIKGDIKHLDWENTPVPDEIVELGLYMPSKGHYWEVVANGFLVNQMSYDYMKRSANEYIVRAIASPDQRNDVSWVVFYQVFEKPEGTIIKMLTYFIGFPVIGVRYAGQRMRNVMTFLFKGLIVRGFNNQLKPVAEKLAPVARRLDLNL